MVQKSVPRGRFSEIYKSGPLNESLAATTPDEEQKNSLLEMGVKVRRFKQVLRIPSPVSFDLK